VDAAARYAVRRPPPQPAVQVDHRETGTRGLAALVHLGDPCPRPGLRLVLHGQYAEAERQHELADQSLKGARALVGDDVVVRRLAPDDAAEDTIEVIFRSQIARV